MAALLTITVLDPADLLQTYGAGAKIWIQRGTTDLVADSSALTSVAIVAGTTEYEYADSGGTPGTDRYFLRYGKSSISTADDASAWVGPLLAGALAGGPLTLETVKTWATISDTADDGWLPIAIGAVNRAAVRALGVDIGSSPDTTRTLDGSRAVQNGRRLWVPGGLRAWTTVETSDDGSTWTDITTDVRGGPQAWERPSAEPYAYLEMKPHASGTLDAAYVRVTGSAFATFGWDAWPMDLVQDAAAALQRMAKDRDGQGAYPSETAAMRYLAMPLWRSYSDVYFPRAS